MRDIIGGLVFLIGAKIMKPATLREVIATAYATQQKGGRS